MHFIFTLKYIAFYSILHDGKHIFFGGTLSWKNVLSALYSTVCRRACRVRDIFRKYVFHHTQHTWALCITLRVHYTWSYVCIISTHPLARSHWFHMLHLSLNIVCVDVKCVVCLCRALWVHEIRPKKNCLRDSKSDHFYHLPAPTSKMWNSSFSCTPTSTFDGTHFVISHIRWSRISPSDRHRADFCVSHSRACTTVRTWALLHVDVICCCTDYAFIVVIIICCVHAFHENVNVPKS